VELQASIYKPAHQEAITEQQGGKLAMSPLLNNDEYQLEQLHLIWFLAQNLSASDPNEVFN
jgi:hypothetical protein